MDIRKVTDQFSVSGQLAPDDLSQLHAAGIRTLIGNRPDGEAPDQPRHADIERRARALGMQVHHLPVVHDTINEHNVEDFAALLQRSPAPIHAWCRSGLRSITLWSLAQVRNGADPEALVANATRAGFDFKTFPDKFAAVIAQLKG